jgi:hypothetical protein
MVAMWLPVSNLWLAFGRSPPAFANAISMTNEFGFVGKTLSPTSSGQFKWPSSMKSRIMICCDSCGKVSSCDLVVVQPYKVDPPPASAKGLQLLFVQAEELSSNTLSCKASAEEDCRPIAKVILSPFYYLLDPTAAMRFKKSEKCLA